MTYSICAWLPERGELGVAVATCKPAIGGRVPFVQAGAGAVASQAVANAWLGAAALALLARGVPARAALAGALAADPSPELRQLHLIDVRAQPAAWTGSGAPDWKGHLEGDGYSVAGNHLVGPAVVSETAAAYRAASGDLAERLLVALEAGDAAGGDSRGRQSAGIVVVRGEPFPYVDVRVDDSPAPVARAAAHPGAVPRRSPHYPPAALVLRARVRRNPAGAPRMASPAGDLTPRPGNACRIPRCPLRGKGEPVVADGVSLCKGRGRTALPALVCWGVQTRRYSAGLGMRHGRGRE
jgi:uncharacterized Ntn-hydrolase superfamily protein